jgi:uncharacterized membrane protein
LRRVHQADLVKMLAAMIHWRNILIAQAFLWMVSLLQNAYYWKQLPDRVATHFNGAGQADGWMHRDQATLMMIGFQTLMPLMFIGIAYTIYFIPASLINIPHREYWLSGDRREASLAFVARSTAAFSLAISLFFLGMNHLTFLANTNDGQLSPIAFWTLLIAFLGFTALWTAGLLLRFRIPK